MLIKFNAPDPRAGTVAQMDSSRGQDFIDSGAAVQVNEAGSEPKQGSAAAAPEPAPAPAEKPAKAKK